MRRTLAAAALLLGAGLAPYPQSPASASCAGPVLEVEGVEEEVPVLRPGESVTVTGRFFVDGCDDVGGGSALGCDDGGDDGGGEVEVPLSDVELALVRPGAAGGRAELGTQDAGTAQEGRLGQVTWTVVVPADQPPGRARLVAGDASLPVRVAG